MRYVVATLDEIPPGGRKIVEVDRRSIGIFNLGGELFALRNICPHQGAPLCLGRLWGRVRAERPGEFEYSNRGEILSCPHHGWEFDIRTGQSWCDPRRLRTAEYEVKIFSGDELLADDSGSESAGGIGQVKGPYVAETVAVSVDGEYVVLDLAG